MHTLSYYVGALYVAKYQMMILVYDTVSWTVNKRIKEMSVTVVSHMKQLLFVITNCGFR